MAIYIARSAAVSFTASTAKTVVQVLAVTKEFRVKEVGISFNGTDASVAPFQIDLMRQTTAGTSSSLTIVENELQRTSPQATALSTFTAEPTSGDILRSWYVTPAGGLWVVQFPLGDEPVFSPNDAGSATRCGLKVTPGSGTMPSGIGYIVFDE